MRYLLIILSIIVINTVYAQKIIKIDHCNCEDVFQQVEPVFNGDYKRICKGKVVEKGNFIKGKKNGLWKTWSKKGNLIRVFNYSSGVPNGQVKFYYPNGKSKFVGQFTNGKKDSVWTFYNKKGKVIKNGKYKNGVPIGLWKVFDYKGKKEIYVYDYEKKKYLKSKTETKYLEQLAVMQNDNTEEWYLLHYPDNNNNNNNTAGLMPLEGFILSNDYYTILMEIPLEYWDTYFQTSLNINLSVKSGGIDSISIDTISSNEIESLLYTFIVTTNDKDKLKQIEQSDISRKLLEYKILEVMWLMGPWVGKDESIIITNHYVINKIKNNPLHE